MQSGFCSSIDRSLKIKSKFLSAILYYLIFVVCVTLYPFNFNPPNGVEKLSQNNGFYFNGHGIVYSQDNYNFCFRREISIEINFKERQGGNNSGPRELLSLYDGAESPPLLIGMYFGEIFFYSRLEPQGSNKWYDQFRPNLRIIQDKEYFITVTYGQRKRALYCNGSLIEDRLANFSDDGQEKFCGQIIVGSFPFCKYGWMGEIGGIAIYDCVLSSIEVSNHYALFRTNGMRAFAVNQGLCCLYEFNTINDIVVNNLFSTPSLYIPATYTPVKMTIMHNPLTDMRLRDQWINDFLLNVFLYIPFGLFLSMLFICTINNRLIVFLLVCSVCLIISFGIETAQIFLPSRYPSIFDIFANVTGVAIGFSLYWAVLKNFLN
jgi:glycopeptide antibiotics resistance protein